MSNDSLNTLVAGSQGTCVDYVLEVATLLDACATRLVMIGPRDNTLSDLALYLATTERQIVEYIKGILAGIEESDVPLPDEEEHHDGEVLGASNNVVAVDSSSSSPPTRFRRQSTPTAGGGGRLKNASVGNTLLKSASRLNLYREHLNSNYRSSSSQTTGGTNSLLFYLINTLQLCLLRINDADRIWCGAEGARKRANKATNCVDSSSRPAAASAAAAGGPSRKNNLWRQLRQSDSGVAAAAAAEDATPETGEDEETKLASAVALARRQQLTATVGRWTKRLIVSGLVGGVFYHVLDKRENVSSPENRRKVIETSAKLVGAVFAKSLLVRRYEVWRLRHRIEDSTQSLSMWQQKWILVTSVLNANDLAKSVSYNKLISEPSAEDHHYGKADNDVKPSARRLLESLPLRSNKGAFWYSQGALRLLLVRRAMDLLYASVGTAMEYTGPSGAGGLWVPLAGICATYYAIAGPDVTSLKATHMCAYPSVEFVSRAWGMVTFPPIKWMSEQASRLFKGLSVGERVNIAGVPCLVLSHSPFPKMVSCINRAQKQSQRKGNLDAVEEETHGPSSSAAAFPPGLESRNVILHVTGGGWFIHTTAMDLPFLSEWSGELNTVIIVPEYDLLPENHFPVALNQITAVYKAVVTGGACSTLGFKPDKIIVTGESAGGNMATAMCVKLCMDGDIDVEEALKVKEEQKARERAAKAEKRARAEKNKQAAGGGQSPEVAVQVKKQATVVKERVAGKVTLPDALLLSCPALNMCHSMSPSRIMGTGDPVLPTGLLAMISDEYVPPSLNISKENPLCSPYFAPDEILEIFPRTLMWVSASDPLLDDAVDLNTRLRRVGIKSEIHAAQYMPHAFWGLANAGFPEAIKVQKHCIQFMKSVINNNNNSNN